MGGPQLDDDECDHTEINIETNWRNMGPEKRSIEIQTMAFQTADAVNQSISRVDQSCQTERPTISDQPIDEKQLAAFLSKVSPTIDRFLNASSISSHALSIMSLDTDPPGCKLVHTLKQHSAASQSMSQSFNQAHSLTSCGFNSSGSLVACGYGSTEHSEWCTHRGSIASWNLLRRQLNPNAPDRVIEMPACVSCVSFHPSKPSLIAVGLYNGEIRVEDLSEDSDQPIELATAADELVKDTKGSSLFHARMDDLHHREAVHSIVWLNDTTFVASSQDGAILTWTLDAEHPVHGLFAAPNSHYQGLGSITNKFLALGLSGFSLSSDRLTFVAATSAGGLIKGLLYTGVGKPNLQSAMVKSGEFKWAREAYQLIDEVPLVNKFQVKKQVEKAALHLGHGNSITLDTVFRSRLMPNMLYKEAALFAYQGHAAPVGSLAYSPFNPTLFASCSYDGSIKLWRTHEAESCLSLFTTPSAYLYGVAWSRARPGVLACCDARGFVHVFDLTADAVAPVLLIDHSTFGACVKVEFSASDATCLIGATSSGALLVWELSRSFAHSKPGELALINQIAHSKQHS